jgi:hypothetical protein
MKAPATFHRYAIYCSSNMPMSRASGLSCSSLVASGSIGSESGTGVSNQVAGYHPASAASGASAQVGPSFLRLRCRPTGNPSTPEAGAGGFIGSPRSCRDRRTHSHRRTIVRRQRSSVG